MISVFSQLGRAGTTFVLPSSDTATGFTSTILTDGGRALCAIMLTVSGNDIKVGYGTPVFGANLLGHVIKKDQVPIYLVGTTLMTGLKYVSALTGQVGYLNITPFYQG
jgi:hypothetical protein